MEDCIYCAKKAPFFCQIHHNAFVMDKVWGDLPSVHANTIEGEFEVVKEPKLGENKA